MRHDAVSTLLRVEHPKVVANSPGVLHVIDNLEVGGAQRLLLAMSAQNGTPLALRIVDLAGRITLFSSMLCDAGIEIKKVGLRRMASPIGWMRLFRYVYMAEEKIVHLHLSYSIVMAAPLAKLLGKRVVVTLHNVNRTSGNQFSSIVIKRLETYCLRHFVDCVIAVGEEVLKSNKGRIGAPQAEVLVNVVPPPPPLEPDIRSQKRQELGAAENDIAILATGRFNAQKDHMNLLSAFVQVYASFPDAVLWLAGDGGLRPRLEKAAHCLNISDRVSFLGRRGDIAELIEAADVFVLSSAWEGFPLGLVEAMTRGLPPVATRVGDVAHVVDEDNGILVEPQNPKQLAEAILRLCKDPGLRRRLSKNAARSVQRFTDLAAWKQSLARIYEKVL